MMSAMQATSPHYAPHTRLTNGKKKNRKRATALNDDTVHKTVGMVEVQESTYH